MSEWQRETRLKVMWFVVQMRIVAAFNPPPIPEKRKRFRIFNVGVQLPRR